MTESIIKYTYTRKAIFYLSLISILFLLTFFNSIKAIFFHGITWHLFIPIISGYLIWINRKNIFDKKYKSNLSSGTGFIIAGIFTLFAGNVTSTLVFSEIAIVIALWGITVCIGGFRLLKKILWPLLYLLFISSGTDGLFEYLTPTFRHSSALLSTTFAKLLGFSILLSDTYIRLPFMTLNVADECSGINHLISLIAITLPIAFLFQQKKWAICLLIASVFPVALLSNSLRVLFLIIYNYNRQIFTHGPNNILVTGSGFFIGLAIIFILSAILSKMTGGTVSDKSVITENNYQKNILNISRNQFLVLSTILFFGFIFISFWKINDNHDFPDFSKLSYISSEWTTHFTNSVPGIDNLPSVDNEFNIEYSNGSESVINLYIGWYAQQKQGREVSGNSYDHIFRHTGNLQINSANYPKFTLRTCQPNQNNTNLIYLMTYHSNKRITDNPVLIKFYTIIDAVFRKNTSASIIIFTLPQNVLSNQSIPDNVNVLINKILYTIDHLQ